ncbi:MAG: LysR substrate-binding domain-containing protein [Opitutaceae bacterium]
MRSRRPRSKATKRTSASFARRPDAGNATHTHRFTDAFTIIAPDDVARGLGSTSKARRLAWANRQNWLLLDESGNAGRRLRTWLKREGITAEPGTTLDSFDLIINLVALGMSVGCVPIRSLALYARKRNIRRLSWPTRFKPSLSW